MIERAVHGLPSELGVRLVVDGLELPNTVDVDVKATQVQAFASRIENAYSPIRVCCGRRVARRK